MTSAGNIDVDAMPPPPIRPKPAKPGKWGSRFSRIFVGAIVAFTVMALLYGPGNAAQMIGLAVLCTAGIGLIPILFISWVVGWLVFETWAAFSSRRGPAPAS